MLCFGNYYKSGCFYYMAKMLTSQGEYVGNDRVKKKPYTHDGLKLLSAILVFTRLGAKPEQYKTKLVLWVLYCSITSGVLLLYLRACCP